MAAFHGKEGDVTWAGTGDETIVTSWSLDATADTAEVSGMGDDWKSYIAGLKDWTATVEVNNDAALFALGGLGAAAASLTLTMEGANTISGDAILTGISPSQDTGSQGTVSLSFQGTGALS